MITMYKNNVSYINIQQSDAIVIEAYLILTKKYLYVFDLSKDEYPSFFTKPIKTEEIQSIQMTLNNTVAAAFKVKNRADVKFVVFEDDNLE